MTSCQDRLEIEVELLKYKAAAEMPFPVYVTAKSWQKTRSDSDESRVDSVRLLRIVGPAATMFGHAASVVFVMATSSL